MTDLVGELGNMISSGLAAQLAVGMVAVGREPIVGMAALNIGTVAVVAKEITGVGRAMLICGSVTVFGEKAGGESESARCGMGMNEAPPVWIEMGVGGSLGRPI